nr:GNAT family N-acetyltransferase [Pseudohoeflea sp. DP4N28-3]
MAKADNARVYVMTAPNGEVIGFYALNAHAVDYQDLPKRYARTRPAHGSIPAAFLSMFGVDQRYTGQGLGGDLLVDALLRVEQAAAHVGIAVVVLDVLDDGNPELVERRIKLYADYGFRPLPTNPLRMFLPVATVRSLFKDGEGA